MLYDYNVINENNNRTTDIAKLQRINKKMRKRILRRRRRNIRQRSVSDGIVQRKIDEYNSQLQREFETWEASDEKILPMAPRKRITRRKATRQVIRRAKKQYGAFLSHEQPEPISKSTADPTKYRKYDFFFKSLELLSKVVSKRVFPEPIFFKYVTDETDKEQRFLAMKEPIQLNKLTSFCLNVGSGKVVAQVLLIYPHASHSNAIMIDLDRKHLFWFEPTGYLAFEDLPNKTKEEQIQYELYQIASGKILTALDRSGLSVEMAPMNISCPFIGPQYREEAISPGSGNCGIWSIMFMHYCLANPTLGIFDINNLMIYSFEPSELVARVMQYKDFLVEYYETGTLNPDFRTFLDQQGFELTREKCQNFLDDVRAKIKPPRNPVSGKPQDMFPADIRELRAICRMRFDI